jgi:hypothetical protein
LVDRKQLGFGWGRGRHVIKTVVTGEALTRALERQQRWVDRHPVVDDAHVHATRDLIDALEAAPGARRQPLTLRMAKATLRTDTP